MMPKQEDNIIRFPHQNTPFGFATSVVDLIGEKDVKGLVVAGMMNDGDTFVGYSHLTYQEVMGLINKLQIYALDLRDREGYE